MSEDDKFSYRSIAKSTAVFGSAKVVEVLLMIVRVKIVAVLLGPSGLGIQSIFQSTLSSINQLSSLGVFQSSVREISQAKQNSDFQKADRVVVVVSRWSWIIGLLSGSICLVMSNLISRFTFKNDNYTWEFAALSLALFFWALSNGNISIMQGRRQLSDLAKASLIGAFVSLLLTLPFYWILGVKGIVPALIIGYLIVYLVNSIYKRKIKSKEKVYISLKETIREGGGIVKLGIVLMLSNVLMTLFSFFVNAFIVNYGDVSDIGFFQAAFTITYGNLIIVIAIMASDYFPRLSAVQDDHKKISKIVNQQTELFLLIVAPLVILLIIVAPIIVKLLYSKDFIIVVPMLRWMALALIFRVVWHSLSYIILAKGDRKTYLIYDALLGNGTNFILNIVAYYWGGLYGLGGSFVLGSILISGLLMCVTRIKYKFRYEKEFIKLFVCLLFLSVTACFLCFFLANALAYTLSVCIFFLTAYISVSRLNARMGIVEYLKAKIANRTGRT